MLDEAPDTTHTNVVTVSAADDETLVNLAAVREFQDDSLVPVTAIVAGIGVDGRA